MASLRLHTFLNHFQHIKNGNIFRQMFLQVINIYAIDFSRSLICTQVTCCSILLNQVSLCSIQEYIWQFLMDAWVIIPVTQYNRLSVKIVSLELLTYHIHDS